MGAIGAVLVVSSEVRYGQKLRSALAAQGLETAACPSGGEAVELLAGQEFSALVIAGDIPLKDAFSVYERLRRRTSVPVVVEVGGEQGRRKRRDFKNRVGKNAYLIDAGNPDLLAQKLGTLLARWDPGGTARYRSGGLTVSCRDRTVTEDGKAIALTPREFDLLCCLMGQAGTLLSCEQLLAAVWGEQGGGNRSTLYSHITSLRSKLKGSRARIVSVRKAGYLFDADVLEEIESTENQPGDRRME